MGEIPKPVAKLITERVLLGSTPQERKEQRDPRKLGIIIVGGAMAGVGPAGAAKRAAELGIFQAADGIYGNSGGLFAAGIVASENTRDGIRVYYDHLNSLDFVNPARLPKSLYNPLATPAVDLRFATRKVGPFLDEEKILASPVPILGSATDAITGESVPLDLTKQSSLQMILYAMEAGAALPVLAGKPRPLGRRLLFDGGVANTPIALQQAIDDGCTDVLILHNGALPQETSRINVLGARIIRGEFPAAAELLIDWVDHFSSILDAIKYWENNPHDDPTSEAPNIEMIVPAQTVGLLEVRGRRLRAAGKAGEEAIDDHFPELAAHVRRVSPMSH